MKSDCTAINNVHFSRTNFIDWWGLSRNSDNFTDRLCLRIFNLYPVIILTCSLRYKFNICIVNIFLYK